MARKEGLKVVNLWMPKEMYEELERQATKMDRTITGDLLVAIRRHLAYPQSPPDLTLEDNVPEKGRKKPVSK